MLANVGISLDMHSVGPEPIPDDLNFCAIPPLKDISVASDDPNDLSELRKKCQRLINAGVPLYAGRTSSPPLSLGPRLGKATDLKAWADWLRTDGMPPAPRETSDTGRDVLSAFARDGALIHELAQGLGRPYSQWTPAWSSRPLPDLLGPHFTQLTATQRLVFMLCLRAAAAARIGDAVTAHQSLLIAV
jgi:hypothetical protein